MNGYKIGWVVTGLEVVGIGLIVIQLFDYPELFTPYSYYGNGGFIAIGAGIVFGFVIPFFHHKPDNSISQNDFPFNFELASSNNRDINGFRITYNMRF